MKHLCLHSLWMKGPFLYLQSKSRGIKYTNSKEDVHPKCESKNNSAQDSCFILPGHSVINIYLILNSLPQSFFFFFEYWISYFLAQHLAHTRIPGVFLPRLEIPPTAATNKQESSSVANVNLIKTQGAGFSVTRIMLESGERKLKSVCGICLWGKNHTPRPGLGITAIRRLSRCRLLNEKQETLRCLPQNFDLLQTISSLGIIYLSLCWMKYSACGASTVLVFPVQRHLDRYLRHWKQ